jgi:uncharacterized protein
MAASTKIPRAKLAQIASFLEQKRFAMVGVSRNPREISRLLLKEFKQRGYKVVVVNPAANEIDGELCYARVQDIVPPVEAALVLTSPARSEQVVRECADAGVKRVWLYGPGSPNKVSEAAMKICSEHGIEVIPGECPFMFLSGSGFVHGVHGVINKILGAHPR